jgi:hypothetical protein
MDEWRSVSSRGARAVGLTSNYTPKGFDSANVKEVFLEEWLNVAKAHMPTHPDLQAGPARKFGDAFEGGGEVVVVIDCIIEHERRSPWVAWGQFPLFPVGDPPPLSRLCCRVLSLSPYTLYM